jgi:hypothetical protein
MANYFYNEDKYPPTNENEFDVERISSIPHYGAPNEDIEYIDLAESRARERRSKKIILILIALLRALYGAWNIWRMIIAVQGQL